MATARSRRRRYVEAVPGAAVGDGVAQHGLGGGLRKGDRARDERLLQLRRDLDDLRRAAQPADAEAGHRERFGDAAGDNGARVVRRALAAEEGGSGGGRVEDDLGVHLVRQAEQVARLAEAPQLLARVRAGITLPVGFDGVLTRSILVRGVTRRSRSATRGCQPSSRWSG